MNPFSFSLNLRTLRQPGFLPWTSLFLPSTHHPLGIWSISLLENCRCLPPPWPYISTVLHDSPPSGTTSCPSFPPMSFTNSWQFMLIQRDSFLSFKWHLGLDMKTCCVTVLLTLFIFPKNFKIPSSVLPRSSALPFKNIMIMYEFITIPE